MGQGWPPASTVYILVAIDIDVVNSLPLAVELILYADDSTLTSVEEKLDRKRQVCCEALAREVELGSAAWTEDGRMESLWSSEFESL